MSTPFSTPMPDFFENMDQYQWRIRYGSAVARFLKDAEMMGREVIEKPPAIADVYVPLKLHEKNLDPIKDKKKLAEESLALPDALANFDRLVISGPPGSGKSTLVRFISFGLGREAITSLAGLVGRRFPIPLILRSLRMEKVTDFDSFLDEWIFSFGANISFQIERKRILFYLEHGWCVLLFDGVDELGETNRKKLRDQIIYPLCKKYPKNKVVITGRPSGFETCAYNFPKEKKQKRGPSFFVQPFTDEDIESFSKKWFAIREKGKHDAARLHKIFVDALTANQSLREMKYRPVYLTMLAVVHEHQGRLPDGRAEAYRSILDTYIDQLDAVRRLYEEQGRDVVPPWPKEDKKRILERLAYRLHLRGIEERKGDQRIQVSDVEMKQLLGEILAELNTIPNFALREELNDNPDQLVDQIFNFFVARTGFIAETAHKRYQFSHLSFQEYLTALHIYRSQLEGNNRRNPIAYLKKELSDRMVHDAWHEVGVLFFCHDALEGGGSQDELLDDITPEPITDGFFKFWVKLLNNHEHQISTVYREKSFDKLAKWATHLKNLNRLAYFIRENWTELADPNPTISRLFLSCSADQGKQLGAFMFLLHRHRKILGEFDWEMVREHLTENFLPLPYLTYSLDLVRQDLLAPALTMATAPSMILFESRSLFCAQKMGLQYGLGLWRIHCRVLLATWVKNFELIAKNLSASPSAAENNLIKKLLNPRSGFENATENDALDLALDLVRARARARDLARARARNLNLDRDLVRARARALALDRARARVLDLDRDLDLTRDRDLDRFRDLLVAQTRVKTLTWDLVKNRAQARARARDLVQDLVRDLDLDRLRDLDRVRFRARVRVRDLALKQYFSLRKLSEKFFQLPYDLISLKQIPRDVEQVNLKVGAFLFFWPSDYERPKIKIKDIQTSLRNLETNYRTEQHTDDSWNFFVEGHNEIFGPGSDLAFLLEPGCFEPDAEWPPDLEPVIKNWDDTLRENGIRIHEPEPYTDED